MMNIKKVNEEDDGDDSDFISNRKFKYQRNLGSVIGPASNFHGNFLFRFKITLSSLGSWRHFFSLSHLTLFTQSRFEIFAY